MPILKSKLVRTRLKKFSHLSKIADSNNLDITSQVHRSIVIAVKINFHICF